MPNATAEPLTEADIRKESVILSLEPKPQTVATPTPPTPPAKEAKPTPAVQAAKPKPKQKAKPKAAPKAEPKKAEVRTAQASQFLELGSGFRIAHKPGSAYSVLYKVVAEAGHFDAMIKSFANKPNLNEPVTARKVLARMMVPVDELETLCRSESSWQEHAGHKTALLKRKAGDGDSQAAEILKNDARASRGTWKGNIPEMVSTCVGSYAAFVNGTRGNKNVQKFADAKLLFRRFRTSDRSYVMMYPEKFEAQVEKALKKAYGA